MPTHRTGKHDFFQVAPFFDQRLDGIAMRDAHYVLLNNRPIIKHLSYVVAGRTDQLNPARKRLMVWFAAHKSRQERVVNVNDAVRIVAYEIIGQNLHVAGEHKKIRVLL